VKALITALQVSLPRSGHTFALGRWNSSAVDDKLCSGNRRGVADRGQYRQAVGAFAEGLNAVGHTITPTNESYSGGIDEIAARSAQHVFQFLDCFANCFAKYVVQLDLALQFNESLICVVETLC
jgi:hypothetical protein